MRKKEVEVEVEVEERELPEGWRDIELGCIAGSTGLFDGPFGSNLKTEDYVEAGVRVVRLENIGRNIFIGEKQSYITGAKYRELIKNSLRPDDIIFSSFITDQTRVCIMPKLEGPAINKADCFCIRQSKCWNKYLLYYLLTDECARKLVSHIHGATRPRINLSQLRSLPIPLPPLPEQERIAARLDLLLGKLKAARSHLDALPQIIARFRKSVLAEAVSGRLTEEWREEHEDEIDSSELAMKIMKAHIDAGGHKAGNAAPPTEGAHTLVSEDFPKEWSLLSLRELVDPSRPITYGILKPGPDLVNGVPYIRVADFPGDVLRLDAIKKTSKVIDESFKRSRLRKGDILLSIRGTYGRVVSVPEALIDANITQDTARLSIQAGVNPLFVMWFLRSETAQMSMHKAAKGVAVRGVNIGDVREMKVPLPSLPEQTEIVRRVDALFAKADALEAKVEAARGLAGRIEPSILAKAFRGELTEQIPEEAAEWEKALAEIEAQAASLVDKPSSRRGPKAKGAGKATSAKRKEIGMAAEAKDSYAVSAPKKRGRPRKSSSNT